MTDIFATAVGDLFADPNLARDALWRVGGIDPAMTLRVIVRNPDRIGDLGETRLVAATMVFELRVAEAPTLAEEDTLEVDGAVYVVQGEPRRDAARLIWTAEARSVPP